MAAKIKYYNQVFNILNYIFLSVFMLICIYPFYYVFIYSISDPSIAIKGIFLLPAGFSFDTYRGLFKINDIGNAFLVSISRMSAGTILTVFSSSMLAYVFTKEEMICRKLLYRLMVITLYINAGLIPWYILMKTLHLKDNFLLYVLPTAVVGFYVILVKTYIEQLPTALEESAMIDGATYFTIFIKIILPLSKPIIATVAVFAAVTQWNTWYDNYFLINNQKLQTLQLLLYNYLNQAQSFSTKTTFEITQDASSIKITPESIKMCITMIVTFPILLVYPFLQKYFANGIMLGAVKG